MPDNYWVAYVNEDGEKSRIGLSSCANSFRYSTGYTSEDTLKVVGWRYEENGELCYELFNVGHTVFYVPLRPSIFLLLACFLSGKNLEETHRTKLYAFEKSLNQGGWKTIERKEMQI